MENIFSLNEAKILSAETVSPRGEGIFLLYQICDSTEIVCKKDTDTVFEDAYIKFTLSRDEVYIGELKKCYDLLPSAQSTALFLSFSGELTSTLSRLYGLSDAFFSKAPEAREIFEKIHLIYDEDAYNGGEKDLKLSLEAHRLFQSLHRSAGTRIVRRASLRIKEYIDLHLEEKTDLDILAKVFFMSRTQIHRLFKEEYGIPPIKYLIKSRIELSKKLLKNEAMKLSEIAERLCFSDAKHFSKTFFSHEGILPSEYRKNIK